jgi:hypothetical protein
VATFGRTSWSQLLVAPFGGNLWSHLLVATFGRTSWWQPLVVWIDLIDPITFIPVKRNSSIKHHEIKFQETLDLIKKTLFQDSRFTSCETLIGLSITQEALIPLLGNHVIKLQKIESKLFETQRKTRTKIPQKRIHANR